MGDAELEDGFMHIDPMDSVADSDSYGNVISSDDEDSSDHEEPGETGAGRLGGFTFDRSITSRHTYLGEVDAVSCGHSVLEEGALLTLPMFYLEGIVLFPDTVLPLRVIQPRFKAAVERAVHQQKTLGVVHVRARMEAPGIHVALIGTTAEIRQLKHLPDGSINIVTRGCQRFRVCRSWTEADGAPCAKVRIIQDDKPLHIPRDAFGALASAPHIHSGKVPKAGYPRNSKSQEGEAGDDPASSEESGPPRWRSSTGGDTDSVDVESSPAGSCSSLGKANSGWGAASRAWASDELYWIRRAQRSYWPHWVYRLYDAYDLARRAADMWRQMVELPTMDTLLNNPEAFSFFIASKMPISDATRQELLEINGAAYRLRREIQLLVSMDRIRCKFCKTVIARRSDMLTMSTDGPLDTFVNPQGFVYETLTLWRARRLRLIGSAETENSWFPGYSWTICNCMCDSHMGWYFQAVKPAHPQAFWGIRRCQIADIYDYLGSGLVVGGSGYVGLHLLEALAVEWSSQKLAYTYKSHPPGRLEERLGARGFHVDLATGEGFDALASAIGPPRVIINCAAISVPRDCEADPQRAMAINVPHSLLKWMASLKCVDPPLLIHFSTDQVYEGTKQFYIEEDETKPVNVYGRTKVESEEFIRSKWKNYAILRSSIIYGPQPVVPVPKSLPVQWMDNALASNKTLDFFYDEYRCPIFIKDVVKVVELLLAKMASGCMQLLLNLGGPDRLSRAEMAETVAQVRGYNSSLITRVSAKSVDRGVASPADISMNIGKLQSALGVRLTPFPDGVKQTLLS